MAMPSFCRSCGERLGAMDRVYCSALRCQEKARTEVMSARFRAISSELEEQDVSAMPKERLLAMLDGDARKYDLGSTSPDLGYLADFVLLIEKVKKHPWDDCAKFLVERNAIVEKIAIAKLKAIATRPQLVGSQSGSVIAPPVRLVPYGRVLKDRVITKSDVESGRYVGGLGDPFVDDLRLARVVYGDEGYYGDRFEEAPTSELELRRYYKQDFSGRTEPLRFPPSARRPAPRDEVFLGFGPVCIGPGETMIFQAMPQFSFRCTRMLIGSDIAPYFAIIDLRVGRDSIMAVNPIPATAFTETAIGIALGLDVVVGLLLVMEVQNTSQESYAFAATFYGTKR